MNEQDIEQAATFTINASEALRPPTDPGVEQHASGADDVADLIARCDAAAARDRDLAEYLRHVRANRPQTADEEVAAAQRLESLEIHFWQVLLSFPPAYGRVEGALQEALSERAFPVTARLAHDPCGTLDGGSWQQRVEALAREVHLADVDRVAAKRAYDAVCNHPLQECGERGGPGFAGPGEYQSAVRTARSAQQAWKNEIVSAQLRLVIVIARRYRFGQLTFADLVQEGTLGLIKAVERFDYRLGFRFSTYASWWVRHAIKRAVADKSRTVRLPVHLVETRTILDRTRRSLTAQQGVQPTARQLAEATGIPEEKVALVDVVPETRLSLDMPANGDGGTSFKDLLEDPRANNPADRMSVDAWLALLPAWTELLTPMEMQIIRWRFGLGDSPELTLREIGDRYNLSRERVRQLQEQALDKIRHRISCEHGITPTLQEC